MNCSVASLIDNARCLAFLPLGDLRHMEISLLCKWATHLSPTPPPLGPFSYDPPTGVINWTDINGIFVGNLAFFNANADIATVSEFTLADGSITAIHNPQSLPSLFKVTLDVPLMANIDFSNCLTLGVFHLIAEANNSVNLSGCTALIQCFCQNNALTSLNLNGCSSLITLDCSGNGFGLTSLDVTTCTPLTILNCSGNGLTTINVTGLANLIEFECNGNLLTSLDVHGLLNLDVFDCTFNPNMLTFDGSGCPVLCNTSGLLDLATGMGALVTVDISSSGVPKIQCYNNKITSLNLTLASAITDVIAYNNKLTSLVVADCTNIDLLYCNDNQITSLDLSANLQMTTFHCENNKLTSLKIGNSVNYTDVFCQNNLLPDTPNGVNECLINLKNNCVPAIGLSTVDLDTLGTNAAPTGAGAAAIPILTGGGWIVTTN